MQLTIKHITHYAYDTALDYSIQRLLLTPHSFASQSVKSWQVSAPGMAQAMQYRDAFGNKVHLITSNPGSGAYDIVAEGVVEVRDVAGVVQGLSVPVPDAVFLRQTAATLPSEPMEALLQGFGSAARAALPFLHELMAATHGAIAYETGTTHAHTTGAEAFAQGRGVCQDHAHVFIGLARKAGVPARYVTGYLVADDVSPAAHAWAEALVPDLGWVGFDAANLKCPTDHYVRVACGLDAAGTAPVRGCRRGGTGEHMSVEVRVEMSQQ
ncbi:MAG: transglutaminase family protein [Alphaproteobacteria bacterium]|nr:transglutaminase family protein [Alphaproteobacteria bacterium]